MTAHDAWTRFWYRDVPLVRLASFRILVCLLLLYDAHLYDPPGADLTASAAEATWRPIYAFELLGLQPPSALAARGVHVVQTLAILCGLVGWRTRTALLVATILGFWSGGVVYSLTKVRHDRVALFFASLALALSPAGARLSVDAIRRGEHDAATTSAYAWWPIRLTQVTLAIGYCAAGLTKLTAPGWTNGFTLQGIVLFHRGPYAAVIAGDLFLCQLLSWFTILVEAGMPLVLWWPGLAWAFVPAAFCFHLGTWATIDTGPYMTLWFFLIAFVSLDRVVPWLRQQGRARPLLAAAAGLLLLAWSLLVIVVMLRVVPPWLLAAAVAAVTAVVWVCFVRAGPAFRLRPACDAGPP